MYFFVVVLTSVIYFVRGHRRSSIPQLFQQMKICSVIERPFLAKPMNEEDRLLEQDKLDK